MNNNTYRKLVEKYFEGTEWDYARIDSIADNYEWDDNKEKVVVCYKTIKGQVGKCDDGDKVTESKNFEITVFNLKLSQNKFLDSLKWAYRVEVVSNDFIDKFEADVYFDFEKKH